MRFACLSEFLCDRASTPIGLARSPYAVARPVAKATRGLDSGVFTAAAAPNLFTSRGLSSLRLGLHLQSFTHAPPQMIEPAAAAPVSLAPSQVSSPLASFQPRVATYPRPFPLRRLRCALEVSHPLDALLHSRPIGLIPSRSHFWGSPFEALLRNRRRTPSRAPPPSWGSDLALARARPAPPGFEHDSCSTNRKTGV